MTVLLFAAQRLSAMVLPSQLVATPLHWCEIRCDGFCARDRSCILHLPHDQIERAN